MNGSWLIDRISTLNKDAQKSEFIWLGTFHWIRSLSILCKSQRTVNELNNINKNCFENNTLRPEFQTIALTQILMSLHFLAGLKCMNTKDEEAAILLSRGAIVSWYYGIFHSAKAMLTISQGSSGSNHAVTANNWDKKLSQSSMIVFPFQYRIPSLVMSSIEKSFEDLSKNHERYANKLPVDESSATACILSYLRGTANWYRIKIESRIKNQNDFKSKFKDYRKKEARRYRDEILIQNTCGFLHEAYRFRGKANYRDSIYLSYDFNDKRHSLFIDDLENTLSVFIKMAMSSSSVYLGDDTWNSFINDIKSNSHLGTTLDSLGVF